MYLLLTRIQGYYNAHVIGKNIFISQLVFTHKRLSFINISYVANQNYNDSNEFLLACFKKYIYI